MASSVESFVWFKLVSVAGEVLGEDFVRCIPSRTNYAEIKELVKAKVPNKLKSVDTVDLIIKSQEGVVFDIDATLEIDGDRFHGSKRAYCLLVEVPMSQSVSGGAGTIALSLYFQYSCRIVHGRTRRKFRANLFRLAEVYSGYTRENTPTDGIVKDGKNINICLIFITIGDLNRFESEVIELLSVFTGHKRPLIEVDEAIHPHELILKNHKTEQISIANTIRLHRLYKYEYQHDSTGNDPDNSAECDGYSDVASLFSSFSEYVTITDPEVCAQMIEDPRSAYWENTSPEAAHIKDKAKCLKSEKDDPNNFIYMSRFLHSYFDGLNAKPSKFPAMQIQYVRHDEKRVPCPAVGGDPNPLGLPPRQRVVVRIIFWNAAVRQFAMAFIRGGGVEIDAITYEIDLYFQDANKAMRFLKWKEAQTEKAWAARRQGVSETEFAIAEQIGQNEQEEDESDK